MSRKQRDLLPALVLLMALVWPSLGPAAPPGEAAPLADDPPSENQCMANSMASGATIEQAASQCVVPVAVLSQIDAIVSRNTDKLVADGGPQRFHDCLMGKVYRPYLGLGSPALPADAETACMAVMEASFWTKPPQPQQDPQVQIDLIVKRNQGRVALGGLDKLLDCLNGQLENGVIKADAEATCMAFMRDNFWLKPTLPAQIDAIVARNAGKIVDGFQDKLRDCLVSRATDDTLPDDAEAACMAIMEDNFWTKASQPTEKSSCGSYDLPLLAGMVSALSVNACDAEDAAGADDNENQGDHKPRKKDDTKDKKDKKDEHDQHQQPQHSGCSC